MKAMKKFPVTQNSFALLSIEDDSDEEPQQRSSDAGGKGKALGDTSGDQKKKKKKGKKGSGKQAAELRSMFMGGPSQNKGTRPATFHPVTLPARSSGGDDEDLGEIDIEAQRRMLMEYEDTKKDLPYDDFLAADREEGTGRRRATSENTANGVGGSMTRKREKIYIKRPENLEASGSTLSQSLPSPSPPPDQASPTDEGEHDLVDKETVDQLRSEIEDLQTKLSKAKKRNRLLVDLLRDTDQKELVEVREELFQLRQEKGHLAVLNAELTSQLTETAAENEQLKSENHDLRKELWKNSDGGGVDTHAGGGGGGHHSHTGGGHGHSHGHGHHGHATGGGRKPRLNSVCSNEGGDSK